MLPGLDDQGIAITSDVEEVAIHTIIPLENAAALFGDLYALGDVMLSKEESPEVEVLWFH
jgi:hypothetical protein